MTNRCIGCSKDKLNKDTVALNKKLFGKNIKKYYCMDCLATYLEITVDELFEKIEEFKEQGCTLFL